ncbi:hypothetical protein H6503_02840 [Candidatus Woesearchaeota archaeon]|nr:hypothetical protein [Candidatus Woesearchaeota archaeon]
MGFGSIAAQMIMFIAIVTIATSVVFVLNNYTQQTTDSLKTEKDRVVDVLKTDITITSIAFDNSTNTTTVYIKNTGKTKLSLNYTEFYIDGLRFSPNNRTSSIEADTEKANVLAWEPTEIARFAVTYNLSSGIHTLRIAASNGVYDEDTFSN